MLKSTLIKLLRQPKIVREQAALIFAGGFTFVLFAIWAFTIPSQFAAPGQQTAGVIESFKKEWSEEAPDLGGVSEGFKEFQAITNEEVAVEVESESVEVAPSVAESPADESSEEVKEVRIITTSSSSEPGSVE